MRRFLAALAFAVALAPSVASRRDPGVHVAQMARDVTDAVRKQRAERRAHPLHQSSKGTKQ
jgi:hypothetical protein